MNAVHYAELLRLTGAEVWVVVTSLIVLAVDLTVLREQAPQFRRLFCALISTVGTGVAVAWLFAFPIEAIAAGGLFQVNSLTQAVKAAVLLATLLSLWLTSRVSSGPHIGEFFCLVLLSSAGMMLLASARDLLTLFVSLELSSIPLYVLSAFDQTSKAATRSSLKYFLLGSTASAFMLFGFSLMYGGAAATQLEALGAAFAAAPANPLLLTGLLLALGGLAFKLAAAPFHLWAPDIYRDATAPASAFISSASKIAAITILFVLIASVTQGAAGRSGLVYVPVGLAICASIIIGTTAAIVQRDLRRLLAYSAVAHAGFMMLSLFSSSQTAAASVFYYASTYGVATVGLFAGVALVQRGMDCPLTALNGLGRRDPPSALALSLLALSLAGVPPTAGFFGKFFLFSELMSPGPGSHWRAWLLLLALGASAVSFYYYMLILKNVYVREGITPVNTAAPTPLPGAAAARTCLWACAILVLLSGIRPDWLLALVLPGNH